MAQNSSESECGCCHLRNSIWDICKRMDWHERSFVRDFDWDACAGSLSDLKGNRRKRRRTVVYDDGMLDWGKGKLLAAYLDLFFCGDVCRKSPCFEKGRKENGDSNCALCSGCICGKDDDVMKGSYTIEAALIIPVVVFSVFFVWFLGFYKHNQTACQAICREAVYVGLEAGRCDKDVEAAMYQVLEEQSRFLPGAKETEIEISAGKKELEAKLNVTMKVPFVFLGSSEMPKVWTVSGQAAISSRHPVSEVRQMRRLEGMLGWQNTEEN